MTKDNEIVRKIIHIDMDAFFASIEQRDFPELRNKPVAVGRAAQRGVVAAASYEARKFGVRSAMSSQKALKLCPHLIFQPPRFDVYKEVSRQIMNIFYEYTDLIEPLSIDEAFLDVTTNKKGHTSAIELAKEIKLDIYNATGLYASAGISINKLLAKIASDMDKPNGLYVIKPSAVLPFIESLPIKKFFGVGAKTAEKMNQLGIYFGKDLQAWSLNGLCRQFGKAGIYFYSICRGIDNRPVNNNRVRKSIGIENTLKEDIHSKEEIIDELKKLSLGLWHRIESNKKTGKTLTLKIKYNNFTTTTHSKTYDSDISSSSEIERKLMLLLSEVKITNPIRLLGLSISNLKQESGNEPTHPKQLTIDFD